MWGGAGGQPALIVTCRVGHEAICEEEIGNVLFPRDPQVRIEGTGYPDVLAVYTKLSADDAYRVVSLREYGFVENVIPVHFALEYPRDIGKVVEAAKALADKGPCVELRVRSRGVRGVSSELYRELARALGDRICKGSGECIFVEIMNERIYVGRGLCKSVLKAGVK